MNDFAHGRESVDDPCFPAGSPPRRSFLVWLAALIAGVAGLLAGLPLLSLLWAGKKGGDWVTLGPIDSFRIGDTRLVTPEHLSRTARRPREAEGSFFLRRDEAGPDGAPRFLVLANYCTHAGCAVAWEPQQDQFHCPCHGGLFHADGTRASGRPRRGMFHIAWRARQEQLEIRPVDFAALEASLSDPSRSA